MKKGDSFCGRNPNSDHYLLLKSYDESVNNMEIVSMKNFRNIRLNWKTMAIGLSFLLILCLTVFSQIHPFHHIKLGDGEKEAVNLVPIEKCMGEKCIYTNKTNTAMKYAAYFKPKNKKINVHDYRYIQQPTSFCVPGFPPVLVVLVPSSPTHVEERKAIRSTWGSISSGKKWPFQIMKGKVKLLFLLGRNENLSTLKATQAEGEKYNDVIQADFIDSYHNLSVKILSGIRWVYLNCAEIKFILKADDDTFVNLPLLVSTLEGYESKIGINGIIFGNINNDAKVRRTGVWKVSQEVYPFVHFPPYAYGNTYVISANIASRIFSVSEYMPYIPIEDAYITGILAKAIDVEHVFIPGFTYWLDHKPHICDFVNDIRISATKVSYHMMYFLWDKLHSNENDC